MPKQLSASAKRVAEALKQHNTEFHVMELTGSTRTAVEAAEAVGCDVSHIAKSLVFRAKTSNSPVMVIACGHNRVDEKKVSRLIEEKIGKADADFVRKHTGYAIGGVPPIGHIEKLKTIIDEDLLQCDSVWAAAGTPNALFEVQPNCLVEITAGTVAAIKSDG